MDENSEIHDEDQQKKKKEEIKKISLARTPMQRFSPIMGELERITKTAFIRKQALNERDRTNLKKTINKIVRGIFSAHAEEISKLQENQPYKYFTMINDTFSSYVLKDATSIEDIIKQLHLQNMEKSKKRIQRRFDFEEFTETDLKQATKEGIPEFEVITQIIEEYIMQFVKNKLEQLASLEDEE